MSQTPAHLDTREPQVFIKYTNAHKSGLRVLPISGCFIQSEGCNEVFPRLWPCLAILGETWK